METAEQLESQQTFQRDFLAGLTQFTQEFEGLDFLHEPDVDDRSYSVGFKEQGKFYRIAVGLKGWDALPVDAWLSFITIEHFVIYTDSSIEFTGHKVLDIEALPFQSAHVLGLLAANAIEFHSTHGFAEVRLKEPMSAAERRKWNEMRLGG